MTLPSARHRYITLHPSDVHVQPLLRGSGNPVDHIKLYSSGAIPQQGLTGIGSGWVLP